MTAEKHFNDSVILTCQSSVIYVVDLFLEIIFLYKQEGNRLVWISFMIYLLWVFVCPFGDEVLRCCHSRGALGM